MNCCRTNYADYTVEELRAEYEKYIPDELKHGYYQHRGYTFTARYEDLQDSIERLAVYDSDVWITSTPKSGTTWLSEMVWAICHDLDTPLAGAPLTGRVRFLEYSSLYDFGEDAAAPDEVADSVQKVVRMPAPRFIKTHLPWECLPAEIRTFARRPRILHVARAPKDAAVSFLHHARVFRGYSGSPELFYEMFLRGPSRWGPYQNNVQSYWQHREEPNVLFVRFEDMKANMQGVIERVAGFLNIAIDDGKLAALLRHLRFGNMQRNENLGMDDLPEYINRRYLHKDAMGGFLREGKVGSHRSEMICEVAERFDKLFPYDCL